MEWDDAFAQLRREYVPQVAARCDEAAALITRLRRQPSDEDALHDLRRLFHNLSGSGGAYGYPDVSRLAGLADDECTDLLRRGGVPGPADLDRWSGAVAALRRQIRGAATTPPAPLSPPVPARRSDAGLRVLVVDDDEAMCRFLDAVLSREAMTVQAVSTGIAARAAAADALPDAMLVDVLLPDGSGYELVADVRRLPGGGTVPIIMISRLTGLHDKVSALRSGADAFFEKPIDGPALAARLRRLLRRGQTERPRILSVENDREYGTYLQTLLGSAGYDVRVCPHVDRFEEDLVAFRPDLVLMDILLSEVNGYDLVRFMRQHESYALLPVLFLTAQPPSAVRLQSVAVGGDDCLQKSDPPAMILATVAARLERARLFKGMLERDGLTQLLTHTAFISRVQAVVAQHRRQPRRAALVMIDVDHFKAVNDRHGHPAGDRVLATLAALLRRRLRQSDIVARYGGEEFAIVLLDIEPADARRLVEQMRGEFSQVLHDAPDGVRFQATFSAGVVMLDAARMDARMWIASADAALYDAKAAGRNRVASRTS